MHKISQKDAQPILEILAQELVKAKLDKLNFLSKLYLWLQRTFVEQIMFKNNKKRLADLVQSHAEGEVTVPTELEVIMKEEATEIINNLYDNSEGSRTIAHLIAK